MKSEIVERVRACAEYIVKNEATVRDAAKAYGVGKSTVHSDIRKKLPLLDPALYRVTIKVLEINLRERHVRGGESTRRKYLKENEKAN